MAYNLEDLGASINWSASPSDVTFDVASKLAARGAMGPALLDA